MHRRYPVASAITLALVAAALCVTSAFGAEDFPIKGTWKADTIEVVSKSGSILTVKINGDTVKYNWKSDKYDRKIEGNSGDDKITISINFGFIIEGELGDDEIQGGEADDVIRGGAGKDTIRGGNGDDWITGDGGKDTIHGGPGNDIIYGNESADDLRGGAGNDLIDGGTSGDDIRGEAGNDMLYGESGKDHIWGGPGNDLIRGGSGNDTLRGDTGGDILLGEGGSDTLEDNSTTSESTYEDQRESKMDDIEDEFGVSVKDYGRAWSLVELGYLHQALSKMPDKVLSMWDGTIGKIKYRRKEICQLPSTEPYSASGLKSNAIYLYDILWRRSSSQVESKWISTICHETGHGYEGSPAMSSSEWKAFKELSDWKGSWPGGTYDSSAKFVSEYAKTNAKEDWAESFAYYFCDPSTLKSRAPEKYDFLNDMFEMYSTTATLTPAGVAPAPGPGKRPVTTRPGTPGKLGKPGRPGARKPGATRKPITRP